MRSLARYCTVLVTLAGCDGSDGGIPGSTRDCAISVAEIEGNSLIQSLFAPDVTIAGQQALSVGIKVEAVPATYTP